MTKSITRSIMLIVLLLVIIFSFWKFGDKPPKPAEVVDSNWHFEHCTSNSSSDCGRLE